MKPVRLLAVAVVVLLVSTVLFTGTMSAQRGGRGWSTLGEEAAAEAKKPYGAERTALAETMFDMMEIALEDEYIARATYLMIMANYDVTNPFANIARAESQHIESLSKLYGSYGIEVPEDRASDHVQLPASLLEAFEAGVHAEIENIAMYRAFLEQDLPRDIKNVFTALMRASENHLQAFQRGLERASSRQVRN